MTISYYILSSHSGLYPIHIALQPKLQQRQVPQFIALNPRMVTVRSGQEFFHIAALINTALDAGAGVEDVLHEMQKFTAHVFQRRHGEVAFVAVDHHVWDQAARDAL